MNYYRLKLTTKKGIVFLSPFVFTKGQAERRLKTSSWLVRKVKNAKGEILRSGSLEMVLTEGWPRNALYNYFRATNLRFLNKLERRWESYDNRENIEEMEEGSA